MIQDEPLGFCTEPDFVRGVQLLPEYGFSFDLCIYHPQMGDVLELVAQCPDVSFLLDHIGKPGIAAGIMQPWKDQLRELASRPDNPLQALRRDHGGGPRRTGTGMNCGHTSSTCSTVSAPTG